MPDKITVVEKAPRPIVTAFRLSSRLVLLTISIDPLRVRTVRLPALLDEQSCSRSAFTPWQAVSRSWQVERDHHPQRRRLSPDPATRSCHSEAATRSARRSGCASLLHSFRGRLSTGTFYSFRYQGQFRSDCRPASLADNRDAARSCSARLASPSSNLYSFTCATSKFTRQDKVMIFLTSRQKSDILSQRSLQHGAHIS